jgi:thiamine transporter ThiT
MRLNRVSNLQAGLIDISAVLFVVGGVGSLVMSLLTIPLFGVALPVVYSMVLIVILAVSLICSLGAIHCYTLATKRALSDAGMRGLIFGALLLIFSLGFVGSFSPASTSTLLAEVSAVLVLVGGIICFILRYTALASSPVIDQPIAQRTK